MGISKDDLDKINKEVYWVGYYENILSNLEKALLASKESSFFGLDFGTNAKITLMSKEEDDLKQKVAEFTISLLKEKRALHIQTLKELGMDY